jgi:hypothetical protein
MQGPLAIRNQSKGNARPPTCLLNSMITTGWIPHRGSADIRVVNFFDNDRCPWAGRACYGGFYLAGAMQGRVKPSLDARLVEYRINSVYDAFGSADRVLNSERPVA